MAAEAMSNTPLAASLSSKDRSTDGGARRLASDMQAQ
jgi:hypothetical protein